MAVLFGAVVVTRAMPLLGDDNEVLAAAGNPAPPLVCYVPTAR